MGLTRAAEDRPTPPAIYNIRIYGLALLACIGSWMFGYNVGVIGGTIVLPSFFNDFHLPPVGSTAYNNITSNIISLLQIGGLAGSLCMFFGMRRYGRKLALAACAGVYLVGAILQTFSYGNLDMMYIGRLITGIGAGGGTVVVPLYLAELSPPAIRGSIVGIYEINNQLSSLVGYWCNYIVNLYIPSTSTRQWQIPLAMQIVPSTVLFVVAIFILPESPRFLVSKDKSAKARRILSFVRHLPEDHEYINSEIADFEEAHRGQERARESQKGRLGMVRELGWKGNRNRVVIGLGLMIGQNFTGINGVNFYTPTIFRSIGVEGTNTILLASGMYAAVKTIATLCSLIFLIDRAGRRKLLLISAVGVSASLWYIGAYITAAHIDLSKSQPVTKTGGSWIAIICVYLYAASFSIAWNGVVWVYCSEIFPARIKDLAVCMTTGTQWLTQFAVARASPYMLSSLKGGFFFFFAACMVVAGVGVWFFVPETKGVGLERMDRIFGSPYDGGNGIGDLEAAGRGEEQSKISKDVDVDVDGDGDVEKGGQRVVAEQQYGLEISISRVRSTRMEQVGISGMGQTV